MERRAVKICDTGGTVLLRQLFRFLFKKLFIVLLLRGWNLNCRRCTVVLDEPGRSASGLKRIFLEELTGCVTDIIYRNDANFYTVFEVQTEDGTQICTGFPADLRVGETLSMQGNWRTHPTYGPQFACDSLRILQPEGTEAIQRYLSSGAVKGIGAALAARIVAKFGADTLKLMEEQPERLAEIKGISLKKAREIAGQMEEQKDLREAVMYLGQFGLTTAMAARIYDTYGHEMYEILRQNPYRLAEDISGIGFARADEIAARLGVQRDSDFRVRSGILYVLSQVLAEGSSYTLRGELVDKTCGLLGVPAESVEIQIGNLAVEKKLFVRMESQEGTDPAEKGGKEQNPEDQTASQQVYPADAYYKELQTARMLLDLDAVPLSGGESTEEIRKKIAELEQSEGMELDDLQKDAVEQAVRHAVLLISGGPGTGKTTTINTIIRYFVSEDMEVLLCAPTGRAARRMTEATGYEAQTIHRLLGVHPVGDDADARVVYDKGRDNPLEADAVIVDEMSMVDMFLFHSLLRAILPGTRLICVGDMDQLPPVGPGQVLRDLLESGAFHSIRLTKIFRQAAQSDIVMNAHAIHDGRAIRLDNRSRDFFFLPRDNAPVIYKHIVQLVRDKLPGYVHCSSDEIQVLTPMRKGLLGVEQLNRVLQSMLNPPSPDKKEYVHGDIIFREGDKVMQIRNDYHLEWEIRGHYGIAVDRGQGVFNGDFGRIRSISAEGGKMTVVFDENREVEYPFTLLDELDLSYAVTVHKSQGSEYPAVILPLLSGPPALFCRNLLYTAVTRAKSCVVILGSRETVEAMIANEGTNQRRTGLRDRVRELAAADGAGK